MAVFVFILFFLLLLAVGGTAGYLLVRNKDRRNEPEELTAEEKTVRAIGLRGLVSTSVLSDSENAVTRKRLMSIQTSITVSPPKSRARQQSLGYSKLSLDAITEVLATIEQMIVDFKVRLKHFEDISAEDLYSSSGDIISNLILARRLLPELEKRADLIKMNLNVTTPNQAKAYELATEGFVLSCDSVNALIPDHNVDSIRWTKLRPKVKEIILKLDTYIDEYRSKDGFKARTAESA